MALAGWKGLGRDAIKWEGTLYADRFSSDTINWIGGTAGSVLFIDANGLIAQDNANLFWDDTNNRLGIGTTSPSWDLTVEKANAGGSVDFVAENSDNTNGASNVRIMALAGGASGGDALLKVGVIGISEYDFIVDNSDSDKLGLRFNAGTPFMTFLSTGNVGIGTTSPNEYLEIANASSGRFIVSDAGGASRKVILIASPTAATNYGRVLAHDYGTGVGVPLILNDSGGKVGIGTTTPNQLLSLGAGSFASSNTTAPTLTLTEVSGAFFISGGAFFYKGDQGTVTLLAAR